jgi:hypothetical protein
VLEWLSKTLGNFDNKHPEISRERRVNTGKWLLREPAFESFMKGDPDFLLLWGYGIRTFIKSSLMITRVLAEYLFNSWRRKNIFEESLSHKRKIYF